MDDIKQALKSAIKAAAEAVPEAAAAADSEGALTFAQTVANLTNALSGITVIEDQELHNAQIGKQEVDRGPQGQVH